MTHKLYDFQQKPSMRTHRVDADKSYSFKKEKKHLK